MRHRESRLRLASLSYIGFTCDAFWALRWEISFENENEEFHLNSIKCYL